MRDIDQDLPRMLRERAVRHGDPLLTAAADAIQCQSADLEAYQRMHAAQGDTIVRIGRRSQRLHAALEAVVAHMLPEGMRSLQRMVALDEPWRSAGVELLDDGRENAK